MDKAIYSINNIVAATDFSLLGELAALRAAQIAQKHGKILHLLHVVHPLKIYPELMIPFDTHIKDYERIKSANGIDLLDKLADKIRSEFNILVDTSAQIGRTHVQIAEFAKSRAASLVVIGFHDEAGLLDMVTGSAAFKLLPISPCPLLMVRSRDTTSYKQVIVAVDLSTSSLKAASVACAVANIAHITLLHVYDIKQEILSQEIGIQQSRVQHYREASLLHIQVALNMLLHLLDDERTSSKIINGYLPESIVECVEDNNVDLVVMAAGEKSVLDKLLLASVSKSVSIRVDCDILLV